MTLNVGKLYPPMVVSRAMTAQIIYMYICIILLLQCLKGFGFDLKAIVQSVVHM